MISLSSYKTSVGFKLYRSNSRSPNLPAGLSSFMMKPTKSVHLNPDINPVRLQSQLERQTFLSTHWFFTCGCQRCSDPTEFGTLTSSLPCTHCTNGNVLPHHK